MKKWFEGSGQINCSIDDVAKSIENPGSFFEAVVACMPGISSTELLEQGEDSVIIRTNEGLMKRTNISKRIEPESIVLDFDEEYQAGKMVTAFSHYHDEFLNTENGIRHRTVISDVKAPGLMGFFYQRFGSGNIGKANLMTYKTYLEKL